jgi:hypothetical protein
VFYGFPLSTADIACNLHLLEDARRKHMFLDLHPVPATARTLIHLSIRASTTLALLANLLLLELEFRLVPIIKVS